MKSLLIGLLIVIFANLATHAQINRKLINSPENGFGFVAPEEWNQQESQGGYVLSNKAKTAAIVIKPHNYKDFETFVRAEVNLEKEGLKQSGEVQDLGKGNRMFRVYNAASIIDVFFILSGYDGGIFLFSITNNAKTADESYYTAFEIIKSVKFSKPQRSQQSSNYQTAFAGKKLTYVYTGNGYYEQRIIWLCASGNYLSKVETGSSSSMGSGSTYSEDQGLWKISQNGSSINLILTSNKGKGQRNLTVTAGQTNASIMLNNSKYFVGTHNECR